jgi:uncharacterized protein YbaR (Trm112 family)
VQDNFTAPQFFSLALLQKNIMISQQLLDIIVCPQCKGPVVLSDTADALLCSTCQLYYEIQDDIPIMLIEEAKAIPRQHTIAQEKY